MKNSALVELPKFVRFLIKVLFEQSEFSFIKKRTNFGNSTRLKNSAGFTLIEIMIALIIFTIIASITAASMHNTLTSREHLTKHLEKLNQWQLTLTMLERDFTQIVDRPIRTQNMLERAALIGKNNYVEFTRGSIYSIENTEHSSNLQRAAWLCIKGSLIRRHWFVLDPPNMNKYYDQLFLDNLQTCKFEYINYAQISKSAWNTDTYIQGTSKEHMPLAIKITLNKNNHERMSLLLPTPGSIDE